jgi:hypothetical protein
MALLFAPFLPARVSTYLWERDAPAAAAPCPNLPARVYLCSENSLSSRRRYIQRGGILENGCAPLTRRFRIFVSSPGDVKAAREIAALTIERLAQDYARFLDIEPYLWEFETMVASGQFQDSIEPPSAFEVVAARDIAAGADRSTDPLGCGRANRSAARCRSSSARAAQYQSENRVGSGLWV